MITEYVLYGERCSGTNYLENLLNINFNITRNFKYGHKHFFGYRDYNFKNTENILFICIVRDMYEWLNSFYKSPHHLNNNNCLSIKNFLNYEIISHQYNSISFNNKSGYQGQELIEDRNIFDKIKRYKNIFELRHCKNKYLIDVLPKKVENYILIKHEDLLYNFEDTLNKIKNKGLSTKEIYPKNTNQYKLDNITYKKRTEYYFDKNDIYNHYSFNPKYETILNYNTTITYD